MILCGLDIATKTGLAKLEDGVYTASTFYSGVKKAKTPFGGKELFINPEVEAQIFRKFEDYLFCYMRDNQITHAAVEQPIPSNPTRKKVTIDTDSEWAGKSKRVEEVKGGTSLAAIYRIYGLSAIAMNVCNRLNIKVFFVAQTTWRLTFLNHGRPSDPKKESVKMCQKMGIPFSSEDAAEAVGIVFWLNRTLNPNAGREGDLFAESMTAAQAQARQNAEKLFAK